jgi:hypothetical protein
LEQAGQRYTVSGRMGFSIDEDLAFGAYRLKGISTGAQMKQREVTAEGATTRCQVTSSFTFIAEPTNRWAVSCNAEASDFRSAQPGQPDIRREQIRCDFNPTEGVPWSVSISGQNGASLTGTASGSELELAVVLKGAPAEGVIITSKNLPVAAASYSRPGHVWMAHALFGDEAHAAAASLLTFMLLEETLTASNGCFPAP